MKEKKLIAYFIKGIIPKSTNLFLTRMFSKFFLLMGFDNIFFKLMFKNLLMNKNRKKSVTNIVNRI